MREMINKIKNRLIIKLIKSTHIHAGVCYALIAKVPIAELQSYIKHYEREVKKQCQQN